MIKTSTHASMPGVLPQHSQDIQLAAEYPIDMDLYVENLDKAFVDKNEFYNDFVSQDMKKLESELFPCHGVHEAELKVGKTYRVY